MITFPDINPDWLLLGNGEMLRQNNQNATDAAVNHEKFYRQYIADKEKIKPLSSHWARHTCATMLLNSGVGMEIVSKVLGHSSTKITREVYAKLLDETVVDAMARISIKKSRDNE